MLIGEIFQFFFYQSGVLFCRTVVVCLAFCLKDSTGQFVCAPLRGLMCAIVLSCEAEWM